MINQDLLYQQTLAVLRIKCESNFLFFCRFFFRVQSGGKLVLCQNEAGEYAYKLRGGKKFILNWHHDEIAKALTRVSKGDLKNLIINIPPRYSKTELAVKMFVAWSLAKNPTASFIHLSYSSELALNNSATIKDLIESYMFQELWPLELKKDSKSKKLWTTKQGGGMYATSTGGQITGFGAGDMQDRDDSDDGWSVVQLGETEEEQAFLSSMESNGAFGGGIIIDDPHKVDDVESDIEREKVNARMNETIASRRNSENTPMIVIMQRLHTMDMSAFLLEGGMGEEFEHLCLPAIYVDGGEEKALWPAKHSLKTLHNMQAAEPRVFAGQYLQTPVPKGGASFKLDWLQYYDNEDMKWGGLIPYIFVDPANAKKKRSDYTAMMVVCTAGDQNYYLADIIRDRLNPTERVNALIDLHKKWLKRCGKSPLVAYEQVGRDSDLHYLEMAQKELVYRMRIIPVGNGQGNKENRIEGLIPLFENARLYIPKYLVYIDNENNRRDMVDEFVNVEYVNFPKAKHDDMLDALARITDRNKEGKPLVPMMFPKVDPNKTSYQPSYDKMRKKPKNFLNR